MAHDRSILGFEAAWLLPLLASKGKTNPIEESSCAFDPQLRAELVERREAIMRPFYQDMIDGIGDDRLKAKYQGMMDITYGMGARK